MRATMRNFRIRWTSEDGQPRESAVSYSKRVADREADAKRAQGLADVDVFEVDPMTGKELARS
ncbi:hypothetical protein ACWDTQ_32645 [Streptomyces cellulosae]|uniref:DUF2188 domain-containing protein n=1 Tax=Streptomyces cellulosae TaxID=1968 RepID=A0ABW6JDM0_STRCE